MRSRWSLSSLVESAMGTSLAGAQRPCGVASRFRIGLFLGTEKAHDLQDRNRHGGWQAW